MTRAADLAKLIAGGGSITVSDNSENLKLITTDADASVGPTLRMDRQSSSAADSDLLGKINFVGHNDAGTPEDIAYAGITAIISDASDGTEDGKLAINTIVAGTERSRIFVDAGETVINEDSIDVDFRVESDGNANMFIVDGGQNKVGIGVSPAKGMLHIQPSARTTNFSASDHTTYADIYVHNPTDDDTCATGIAFATDASSFDNGASGIACISGTGDSESSLAFITRPNGAVAAEAIRIDSSQNVGIGTTSAAAKLHVQSGDGSISPSVHADELLVEGSGNSGITIGSGTSGLGSLRFADSGGDSQGNIAYDHSDNSLKIFTADSEAIRIISDGKVSIGGFNPAANLHVGGTGTPEIRLQDTDTSGGSLKITHNAGTSTISADPDNSSGSPTLTFSTVNSERMRINTTGQVLIGTTSSLYSSTQKDGLQIEGAGGGPFVIVSKNVDTSGGANQILFLDGSGDTCGEIASNATNNTTSYGTSSDYRLKENITDVTNAISTFKKLKPKTYNFISDPDNIPEDGFLAHELGAVVPNAVTGEKDAMTSDNKIKPQQVDYGRLTPLLTAALQEAIAKIETLEAKVATLESK